MTQERQQELTKQLEYLREEESLLKAKMDDLKIDLQSVAKKIANRENELSSVPMLRHLTSEQILSLNEKPIAVKDLIK